MQPFVRLVVLVFVCACLASLLPAQSTTSLRGDIVDPAGGAVVGARLTLTNVATGAERQGTTDSAGGYLFALLPPGRYRLRVEAAGFKSVVREEIELLVGTPARLDIALELGQITEVISVEAEAPLLNTSDASIGNAITTRQVVSLPLEQRSIMSLLTLQPGVTFSGDPFDQRSGSVTGGRSDQANATLDGVDINDQQIGDFLNRGNLASVALPVPVESLQEFRFVTSTPTAEYGRSSGGQLVFVTKSGTNDWHGTLFWTHRNTATTANDFFNNRSGVPVPKLHRHQYGGSVGGPIMRDRLFFFATYEGTKRREESNELRIVPTDSLRQGSLKYLDAGRREVTLSPADVRNIDPLGQGVNPAMLAVLQAFPSCNDFTQGIDSTGQAPGLNFCGFRFNAPVNFDNNIYVARFDYHVTRDAKHMLNWRGTLGDLKRDITPQQFPGQATASQFLDNSKGFAAGYTALLKANLTSNLRFGYTRLGREFSGQTLPTFSIRSFDLPFSNARALTRILPTYNIAEDATWVKGSHSLQFGTNLRWITNTRTSFANSFATYAINDGFCVGLCNSLPRSLGTGRLAQYPAVPSASENPFKRAAMGLYGSITQIGSSYHFSGNQNVLANGTGVGRQFSFKEYEFYAQDTWRATRSFTLNFGLRYGRYGIPYETNGLQTMQTVDVMTFFNQRITAQNAGRASATVPPLSWNLAGPENNAPSYFRPDKNNWAPSFGFAWTPDTGGRLGKVFGGRGASVIRGGFRVLYDRIGGRMVTSQDLDGSVGLVTNVQNRTGRLDIGGPACTSPPSANCAAPRFAGLDRLPAVPSFVVPPAGGFPSTPAETISNRGLMIDNGLRTPYSFAINLSYARELPGNMSIEGTYVSRLARKLLTKADLGAPLIYLRDPRSGTTYAQAVNQLYAQSRRGAASAGQITPIPYFENLFSNLARPGVSATQAAYGIARTAFPSFTDSLLNLEGEADLPFPTFFQQQFDSLPAWTNLGGSSFHALILTVRKRLSRGLLFDFNYTYGKSIDNASQIENAGRLDGQIADAFFPRHSRALSSFDLRHQMTSNWVYEVPVGRGRYFGGDFIPRWLDLVIGGWQTSGIVRWRGAFPISPSNGFNFPTNFFLTTPGTLRCRIPTNVVKRGDGVNLIGFEPDVQAAFDCLDFTLAGGTGSRSQVRGVKFFNTDFALRKAFNITERQKFVLAWDAFNIFNHPNFDERTVSLNPESRSTFGRLAGTVGQDERNNNGRSMQFSLRFEF